MIINFLFVKLNSSSNVISLTLNLDSKNLLNNNLILSPLLIPKVSNILIQSKSLFNFAKLNV